MEDNVAEEEFEHRCSVLMGEGGGEVLLDEGIELRETR